MSKTVINTSPYDLCSDHGIKKFTAKCKLCAHLNPDKYGMPQCPVFETLTASILDRSLRWKSEWVEVGKDGPQCKYATAPKEATSG